MTKEIIAVRIEKDGYTLGIRVGVGVSKIEKINGTIYVYGPAPKRQVIQRLNPEKCKLEFKE